MTSPKVKVFFSASEWQANHVLSYLTRATLQDVVIANHLNSFRGQHRTDEGNSIVPYLSQGICRLTASVHNSRCKIWNKVFENIFETADHECKDAKVMPQFTKTDISIATRMKKHTYQFILTVGFSVYFWRKSCRSRAKIFSSCYE